MAVPTITATSVGKSLGFYPELKTRAVVIATADNGDSGESTALAVAHGGPSGRRPDDVQITRVPAAAGTEADAEVDLRINAFDTTNDEVDVIVSYATDPAATKVAQFEIVCIWKAQAASGAGFTSSFYSP